MFENVGIGDSTVFPSSLARQANFLTAEDERADCLQILRQAARLDPKTIADLAEEIPDDIMEPPENPMEMEPST